MWKSVFLQFHDFVQCITKHTDAKYLLLVKKNTNDSIFFELLHKCLLESTNSYSRLVYLIIGRFFGLLFTIAPDSIQATTSDCCIMRYLHMDGPFTNFWESCCKCRISMTIHVTKSGFEIAFTSNQNQIEMENLL